MKNRFLVGRFQSHQRIKKCYSKTAVVIRIPFNFTFPMITMEVLHSEKMCIEVKSEN